MTWLTNTWNYMHEIWSFRHEPEHFRRLADFYWRALLLIAAVAILGAVSYGTMKFIGAFEGEESLLGESSGGIPLLNQRDLQAVLEAFDARAARYESLKSAPPQITDPSR